MADNSYKDRMREEYLQLKDRYNKLHRMIIKALAGTLESRLNCPLDLFEDQAAAMGQYLRVLEIRAEIEKINLTEEGDSNA